MCDGHPPHTCRSRRDALACEGTSRSRAAINPLLLLCGLHNCVACDATARKSLTGRCSFASAARSWTVRNTCIPPITNPRQQPPLQPRPNTIWLDGTSNTCQLPACHTMIRRSLRCPGCRYRDSRWHPPPRPRLCPLGRCRLPGSPPRRRGTRALKWRDAGVGSRRRKQKRCRSSPYAAANNVHDGI
jgi:hypothetical protein